MPDLLLELRSEEIPARMQAAGAESLRREVEKRLQAQALDWGKAEAFATPRRLALIVRGLPAGVLASQEEVRGPRVGATYEAVEGFLRSTGVARDALEKRGEGTKAAWFATREIPARTLDEVLAEILPEAVRAVRWPKSMRWGRGNFRWVRPLRGILCIVGDGDTSRPVALDIEGIPCGAVTRGHPYRAPEEFTIKSVDSYESQLREVKVILRAEDRCEWIRAIVDRVAEHLQLIAGYKSELLDEIAGLVEWPKVYIGSIDDVFSDLPNDVLHTSMNKHQKFISLFNEKSGRIENFLAVADIEAADGVTQIRAGYERVLRARLEDALFFWQNDLRTGIEVMHSGLSGMVFHFALGDMEARTERISGLAEEIAREIGGLSPKMMRRAGKIAKADLCSETVREFPELQGIAGALLAKEAGEDPKVCAVVARQYRPVGRNDRPAQGPAALVLADRADMLWGFFAAGERPTGSRDPYALRRATLGILRTLIEKDIYFSLHKLISLAEQQYAEMPLSVRKKMSLPAREDAHDAVVEFMLERLRVYLREGGPGDGYCHDFVIAAARRGAEDDPRWFARLVFHLDQWFRPPFREPAKDDFLAAYRRVASILDAEGDGEARKLDRELCRKSEEENSLVEALDLAEEEIKDNRSNHDPQAVLEAVAKLRGPVHRFFEKVHVNDPNPKLRLNRLHLLAQTRAVMEQVADFGAIEG